MLKSAKCQKGATKVGPELGSSHLLAGAPAVPPTMHDRSAMTARKSAKSAKKAQIAGNTVWHYFAIFSNVGVTA